MSNIVKSKFVGLLRGLLRRFDNSGATMVAPPRPLGATAASRTTLPRASTHSKTQPIFARTSAAPAADPGGLQLPLPSVIAGLPMDLRAKLIQTPPADAFVSIPVEKILSQLARGSVKISFGELRQLAPGVFGNSSGELDAKMVALPLNQILAQLNPALLARRSAKKQIEIAADISSPFDARGHGLIISPEPFKSQPKTPVPEAPLPMSRFNPPVSEKPVQPPPVGSAPVFTPRWTMPSNGEAAPRNGNGSNGNGASKAPYISSPISAAPVPCASAAPIPPTTVLPGQPQPTISAPLAAISEHWPEALQIEINQLNLMAALVALPVHLVEPMLKRGRVIFSWRDLRSWIKPEVSAVSVHDGIELELPLKVLAPLFFARQKNGTGQRKVSVSEEIPNLFFGFPSAEPTGVPPKPAPSAVAAATPLPDTNFFSRSIQPQTTDSEFKRKGGTDFTSRAATPSEIVSRAMQLPGVAGVVIALPDGLKVASQIPSDLNGDTLAAFIPQLFARVNQCSRELRMGDLNNLSFTVGNVPWKIFRVNAVYFAAFGRMNESLPTAQLAALATELDHKKQ